MSKKGFTLVELLAVIALLGILVLLIGPRVLDKYNDAQKGILLDEAKSIYTEATNKYLQERTNGKRITQIYSSMDGSEGINELDLVGEDVNYTIRLDKDGNVTALKVDNKRYCVEGIGKFLENATINDVISLQDNPNACQRVDLMENERVRFRLLAKNPDLRDVNPKTIYLRYKKEWLNEEGKKITTITETPKMSNYMFDGFYYTDDEGAKTKIIDETGKIVGPTDVVRKSTDEGVTASAEYYKKYYTVTYNGNNAASGSMAPSKHEYLEATALTQNAFSKEGYVFKNWNTLADGTGISYADKQNMPVVSDETESDSEFKHGYNLKLYAQWKAKEYTLTFNANGGSVSPSSKTVTYNQSYGTLPTPTKSGYKFIGWYTESTGGSEITSSNIVNIFSDQVLYAHWEISQFTITYDCNFYPDATYKNGSMSNELRNYNENISLSYNVCSQFKSGSSGYIGVFKGWSTSKTGSAVYTNGQTINITNVLTNNILNLYAVWGKASGGNVVDKGNGDWYIKFTKNTDFVVNAPIVVDAFLVGGGGKGGDGAYSGTPMNKYREGGTNGHATGGTGGKGGQIVEVPNIQLDAKNYSIKIGGSGAATTAFGYTASGGGGAAGGAGGISHGNVCNSVTGRYTTNPVNGTSGKYAFGDSNLDGVVYGTGGKGGKACALWCMAGAPVYCSGNTSSIVANNNGAGGHGGEGGWYMVYDNTKTGESGASGVVIIRNPRGVKVDGVVYGTYSGTYVTMKDSSGTSYVKFISSGVFVPNQQLVLDAFLVGGGASGNNWSTIDGNDKNHQGGNGGNGGELVTKNKITLNANQSYTITIGSSNQSTTAFGYTAQSGAGSAGGKGGISYGNCCNNRNGCYRTIATQGFSGIYAFGDSTIDGIKYGAGGGGGGACATWCQDDGSVYCVDSSVGGGTGAGNGGGANGTVNTGAGGGGATINQKSSTTAGVGGSGVVIVRKTKNIVVNGKSYGTYSGSYTTFKGGDGKYYIKFLTSGLWVPDRNMTVNAFLVAGGKNGGKANLNDHIGTGGAGGNGGEAKTINNISITANQSYNIIIGSANNNTTAFSNTAISGSGSAGGAGAISNGSCGVLKITTAVSGRSGIYAFGNNKVDGVLYGSGGSGGRACSRWCEGDGAVRCAEGTNSGNNGTTNTGMGGNGAQCGWNTNTNYTQPGIGGSGVVIINVE